MQCKRKTHALARRFGCLGPESDSNPDPVSAFSASLVHALFPVERRGYGGLPDIVLRRSVHRAGNGNCERDKPPRRHRRVDGFVWGPIMILLLLFTHIFMTVRTGFIQRKLGTGIKMSVTKDDPSDASGDITQFGALTTLLPPRSAPATSSAWARAFCSAARAPSSGCGWRPSSAWPPSTARRFSRRSTRPRTTRATLPAVRSTTSAHAYR